MLCRVKRGEVKGGTLGYIMLMTGGEWCGQDGSGQRE